MSTLAAIRTRRKRQVPQARLLASNVKNQKTRGKVRREELNLVVVIEKDADGYFAHCPALQGCYTQGETYDEALNNIRDAVQLHLEDRRASGEPLPSAEAMTLTMVQVRV